MKKKKYKLTFSNWGEGVFRLSQRELTSIKSFKKQFLTDLDGITWNTETVVSISEVEEDEFEVGDTIVIKYLIGRPYSSGKMGVVESISEKGELFGTWGDEKIHPNVDLVKILRKG